MIQMMLSLGFFAIFLCAVRMLIHELTRPLVMQPDYQAPITNVRPFRAATGNPAPRLGISAALAAPLRAAA